MNNFGHCLLSAGGGSALADNLFVIWNLCIVIFKCDNQHINLCFLKVLLQAPAYPLDIIIGKFMGLSELLIDYRLLLLDFFRELLLKLLYIGNGQIIQDP